jgi:hypothetical protein
MSTAGYGGCMAGSVLAGVTVLAQLAIAAAASQRQGVRGAFAIPTFRSRNTRTLAGTAPSADRYFAIPEVLAGSVLADVIVRAQLAIAATASHRQVFHGALVVLAFRTRNTRQINSRPHRDRTLRRLACKTEGDVGLPL